MEEAPKSKEEMIEHLMQRFRKLLEEKLPDEPGTLEKIEKNTEEIGSDIKRDVENECVVYHGTGYVGGRTICRCGGAAKFKTYYEKYTATVLGETNS